MQAVTQIGQFLKAQEEAAPFKRNLVGWIVVVLNILAALNSTYFFLGQMKVGVVGWIMMNTCAPSIAVFVIGFLTGSPLIMVAGSLMMFRYGTLGLFVFGWDGFNLIAQIGHILMTLGVTYTLVDVIRNRRWRALVIGVLVGAAILIPLGLWQVAWFNAHPGLVEDLFQGTLTLE
jgi:hypothetical protein